MAPSCSSLGSNPAARGLADSPEGLGSTFPRRANPREAGRRVALTARAKRYQNRSIPPPCLFYGRVEREGARARQQAAHSQRIKLNAL